MLHPEKEDSTDPLAIRAATTNGALGHQNGGFPRRVLISCLRDSTKEKQFLPCDPPDEIRFRRVGNADNYRGSRNGWKGVASFAVMVARGFL